MVIIAFNPIHYYQIVFLNSMDLLVILYLYYFWKNVQLITSTFLFFQEINAFFIPFYFWSLVIFGYFYLHLMCTIAKILYFLTCYGECKMKLYMLFMELKVIWIWRLCLGSANIPNFPIVSIYIYTVFMLYCNFNSWSSLILKYTLISCL